MTSAVFAIGLVAFGTVETNAQGKYCNDNNNKGRYERRSGNARYNQARYQNRRNYGNEGYYGNNGYYEVKQPNVYDRHRKAINLSVGTAAGAAIGAAVGGKKGALIGAGVGLATGAIVTAKQKPRNYPRY
ncbi:MAG: hypothetical protein IPM50_12410 [Acidobacteriota bacterium]|nr:MAG: hypothetical protein IPM50_12410 [Acidobacteriota bacterium]